MKRACGGGGGGGGGGGPCAALLLPRSAGGVGTTNVNARASWQGKRRQASPIITG